MNYGDGNKRKLFLRRLHAGHSGDTLTDEEVKAAVELNRQEYGKAYAEYVSEFSDGNIQIDENDDEPYDDNDFEEIETE